MDAMMEVTKTKMGGEKIRTATFVWMQGEADSKAQNSDVYLASLNGLKKQLEQDWKAPTSITSSADSATVVSTEDETIKGSKIPTGKKFAELQQAFADASQRALWIDTDDLNGEKNALHLIKPDGYSTLGERYVDAAEKLINENSE